MSTKDAKKHYGKRHREEFNKHTAPTGNPSVPPAAPSGKSRAATTASRQNVGNSNSTKTTTTANKTNKIDDDYGPLGKEHYFSQEERQKRMQPIRDSFTSKYRPRSAASKKWNAATNNYGGDIKRRSRQLADVVEENFKFNHIFRDGQI